MIKIFAKSRFGSQQSPKIKDSVSPLKDLERKSNKIQKLTVFSKQKYHQNDDMKIVMNKDDGN